MEIVSPSGRYPALKYHDFRLLWFGQFISNAGTQMQIVALNWQIYILTHSAVALGIIGLARFIPIVLFSLIGGSFADAHNRKKVLLITQTALALLSFTLALTTFLNVVNAFIIYSITALAAVTISFDSPARQALVPNLVRKEHLSNAMSLNVILFQVATIMGPAISGFIIGFLGVGPVYLINSVSFGAVILALILMKNSGAIEGTRTKISFSSIKEGLSFVKARTMIWSTMILDFFSTFFASATVLLPIYAKDILAVGPQGLGFLYAAPSIGAVVAGSIIAASGTIKKQGIILLSSIAVFGFATILFGVSTSFILSLAALFFVGAGDSISTIIRNTIRQLETPDNIRGRMTAINMIFFMGGPQLGEFEAGILAAAVGAPLSVVTGGVGAILAVLGVAIFIPKVRKYQNHHSQPS